MDGFTEKRNSSRVNIHLPIKCRIVKGGKFLSEIDTYTRDVSAGGLGFSVDKFLPLSCSVVVELYATEHVKCVVQLVWIKKASSSGRFEVGGKFVEDYSKETKLFADLLREPVAV